ncbi:MAG: protein kinase [Anaerolineae bacterium]|nr:protein kinase [Anaerolineae bacterium]
MSEELEGIQPGRIVGPFCVLRGFKRRGGMARIFEVEVRDKYRQPNVPRRLALKVAKQEHQAALVTEADYLSRFDHPNVVRIVPLPGYHRRVYAAREQFPFGWGWYYAMELLTGGCLDDRMTRTTDVAGRSPSHSEGRRQMSVLHVVGIARQLLAALDHIHARHVINLDVKPGNVLFRRRSLRFLRGSVPQAVLCDFGIARDLRYPRAGLLGVATPEYVSPEQAMERGKDRLALDVRSDIFSLGTLLYEMLMGRLPFENVALACDTTSTPMPPRQLRPAIPPALEDVVMRALAKDPAQRFQTAAEMRAALGQVRAPVDGWAVARRAAFGAGTFASLTACLALGGLGASALFAGNTPTPPPSALPTDTPALTATLSPTVETPTQAPTSRPTSTVAPTYTPTATPRPLPTATPTPESGG